MPSLPSCATASFMPLRCLRRRNTINKSNPVQSTEASAAPTAAPTVRTSGPSRRPVPATVLPAPAPAPEQVVLVPLTHAASDEGADEGVALPLLLADEVVLGR